MSNMGLKTAIFNKNAIKYTKWPLLTAYNSWIWPHFLIKQNAILLRKKCFFRWPTSNSMKKIIEKVQNWQIQRWTPQGRTMHTLYPVNHLIKTTPESTLGLHFDHSNSNTSCWEISNFISCISFEHHCRQRYLHNCWHL